MRPAIVRTAAVRSSTPSGVWWASSAAILEAGRATGDLRSDVAAEDIAASLIGVFTVAPGPGARTRQDACSTS